MPRFHHEKVHMIGANDVSGGTPHRHATVDAAGRLLTECRITQSPTINGKLDAIAANTPTTGEWLASGTLADVSYSTALDCTGFKSLRLLGKSTGSLSSVSVLGSQTTDGTYYALPYGDGLQNVNIDIAGTPEEHLTATLENCPNFIKLYNHSGSAVVLELDYIGYSN